MLATQDAKPLAQCSAIVVAHDHRDVAALLALGHKVGFGSVLAHARAGPAIRPRERLIFFLVHFALGDSAKRQLLDRVRRSPAANVRLAPVVLFTPDGPYEEMLAHIEMGFDDVICLPEKSPVLAGRLAAQLGQEHLYIQTATYLGPDRRRMERPGHTHPGRRAGGFDHTQLTVLRTPDAGARVVKKQIFLSTV